MSQDEIARMKATKAVAAPRAPPLPGTRHSGDPRIGPHFGPTTSRTDGASTGDEALVCLPHPVRKRAVAAPRRRGGRAAAAASRAADLSRPDRFIYDDRNGAHLVRRRRRSHRCPSLFLTSLAWAARRPKPRSTRSCCATWRGFRSPPEATAALRRRSLAPDRRCPPT